MNTQLLLLINGLAGKNSLLDGVMVFCASYLIYVIFFITAFVVVLAVRRRQWRPLGWFTATVGVAYVLLQIAAKLYVDHRPFVDHHLVQLVSHAAGKSFPSDHTTATAAIGLAMAQYLNQKVGLTIFALAFLIGFARIFTGLHYPVDIIGGIGVGTAAAALVYGTNMRLRKSRTSAGV